MFTHLNEYPKKPREVGVGESITLTCPADRNQKPTVEWFKDGKPINRTNQNFNFKLFDLKIKSVGESDGGNYRCVASNQYGNISLDYSLKVEGNFMMCATLLCRLTEENNFNKGLFNMW